MSAHFSFFEIAIFANIAPHTDFFSSLVVIIHDRGTLPSAVQQTRVNAQATN